MLEVVGQALHPQRVAERAHPDRHRGRGLFDLARLLLFLLFLVVFVVVVAFAVIFVMLSFLLLADLILAVGLGVGDRAVGERGAPRGAVVVVVVVAALVVVALVVAPFRIVTAFALRVPASCLFSFLDLRSHVRIVDQKRLHPVGERDRAVEALVRRRDVDGLRGRRRRQRRLVEQGEGAWNAEGARGCSFGCHLVLLCSLDRGESWNSKERHRKAHARFSLSKKKIVTSDRSRLRHQIKTSKKEKRGA